MHEEVYRYSNNNVLSMCEKIIKIHCKLMSVHWACGLCIIGSAKLLNCDVRLSITALLVEAPDHCFHVIFILKLIVHTSCKKIYVDGHILFRIVWHNHNYLRHRQYPRHQSIKLMIITHPIVFLSVLNQVLTYLISLTLESNHFSALSLKT